MVRVGNLNLQAKTDGTIRAKTTGDFTSEAIIATFGSQFRKLDLPREDIFVDKGVSCCTTCNCPLFKCKTAGVIDSGNAATAEALYLWKFTSSIKDTPVLACFEPARYFTKEL